MRTEGQIQQNMVTCYIDLPESGCLAQKGPEETMRTVELEIGTVVRDVWKVTGKLGEGGCGVVYEVISLKTKRRAALKAELTDKEDEILKMEVFVLRKLQTSSHACRLLMYGKLSNFNFVVMTLLGRSLSDIRRQFPEQRADDRLERAPRTAMSRGRQAPARRRLRPPRRQAVQLCARPRRAQSQRVHTGLWAGAAVRLLRADRRSGREDLARAAARSRLPRHRTLLLGERAPPARAGPVRRLVVASSTS